MTQHITATPSQLAAHQAAKERALRKMKAARQQQPKQQPVKRVVDFRPYQAKVKTAAPEWKKMPTTFDSHVDDYRAWKLQFMRFPLNPVKEYINRRANELGYTYEDMVSPCRNRDVVFVRQFLVWEVKNWVKPDASLVEIGGYFGGRDHTTMINALRKIDGMKKQGLLQTHDLAFLPVPRRNTHRNKIAVLSMIRQSLAIGKEAPSAAHISSVMGWESSQAALTILKELEKEGKINRPTRLSKDIQIVFKPKEQACND